MFRNLKLSRKSKREPQNDPESERKGSVGGDSVRSALSSLPQSLTSDPLRLTSVTTNDSVLSRNRHPSTSSASDRKNEPLGLHVIHDPGESHAVDIIFVHGLGGTSRMSWSWDRDLANFWPQEWLPLEPELSDARILTFGYNAHFMSQKGDVFNISDFAKDLLLQMKFGLDANVQALEIGKVPILFVVHSMGGLVVKKAYILGCNDPQYKAILDTVSSIIFLATPHRGSGLAEVLNRFLQLSVASPKQYVSDLQKSSARIRDINDQFRLHAPRMQIVSFFETLQTSIGPKKVTVVDRDSAILDYPDEISSPLNADHHTVCKYSSPSDANYISVRNVLTSMVSRFKRKPLSIRSAGQSFRSNRDELAGLLDFEDSQEQELQDLMEQCVPTSFTELEASSHHVQHFFFRHDDQGRRSIRRFIISLAFQLALRLPSYRQRLLSFLEDRESVLRSDARTLWQKLVCGLLIKDPLERPLLWIIDALDESESSQLLLSLLQSLAKYGIPIRIAILSRPHPIARSIDRLRAAISPEAFYHVVMSVPEQSLQCYIDQELQYAHWTESLTQTVTQRLLSKSRGNFLWLHLVMKELIECNTQEAVDAALSETPMELSELYQKIHDDLARELRPADKKLAKAILSWITCSEKHLLLDELKEALAPQFPLIDLKSTIEKLCGDFVVVDKKDGVSVVHHTAKEFLLQNPTLELAIDAMEANTMLFTKCLDLLMDPKLRYRLRSLGCRGFVRYASTSWPYHLARAGVLERAMLLRLASFFRSQSVLSWINAVALTGQLRTLVVGAKALTAFIEKRRRADSDLMPLSQPLQELELLGQWAVEMSIYSLIPSFCPRDSAIYRLQIQKGHSSLRVTGISNRVWDDCVAKFSVGQDCQPTAISCTHGYFGILATDETVNLYHSSTFQEARKFEHPELVLATAFDQEGKHLITCGYRTVRIWELSSGQISRSYDNPKGVRAMAATFSHDGSSVILCCDDSNLWSHSIDDDETSAWESIHREFREDPSFGGGRGSPICAAFSPEGNQIAMAFRGTPLCVWSVEHGQLIGRCERVGEKGKSRLDLWSYAQRLCWNPTSEHIIGIYNDGCVFKWFPLDSESEELEVPITATEIACSPDGRFLVTASGNGSLRIWNFDNFSLLYHLSCNSSVTAIAVSPDGRRIYDVRESYCNVWEPNALTRLAEADEKASETSSSHAGSVTLSLASEASASVLEPITALAVSTEGSAFCSCNDGGMLTHVADDGNRTEAILGYMGATLLAWSDDDSMVATAELDGSVNVRRLPIVDASEKLLEARSNDPVLQLLFINQDSALLIRSTRSTTTWSLKSKCIQASRALENGPVHWLLHPSEPNHLLSVTADGVLLHATASLEHLRSWFYDRSDTPASAFEPVKALPQRALEIDSYQQTNSGPSLRKVWITPDKADVVVELSYNSKTDQRLTQLMMVNISEVLTQSAPTPNPAQPILNLQKSFVIRPLPRQTLDRIQIPLGFIHDSLSMASTRQTHAPQTARQFSLVFIDHNFWICTWSLSDVDGTNVRRHFFLPHDWVSIDCLELAQITKDGRFLCPRNGEVAIVSQGLRQEWVD
ncbi:hypothetical protein E8E14_002400 [Neopestalotiopsis sp. 37M]|nr:hypothetical protein E8E14_002400 [Neopestalotiopsis sp. 37M]